MLTRQFGCPATVCTKQAELVVAYVSRKNIVRIGAMRSSEPII